MCWAIYMFEAISETSYVWAFSRHAAMVLQHDMSCKFSTLLLSSDIALQDNNDKSSAMFFCLWYHACPSMLHADLTVMRKV